ncbi:MAG: lipopolysaccharide biosynthesis protein, partial [Desulfuromonadales bacterium]|nr:lipopolysaccharide biosynthesis protein [Desulfuromonadales bacterium]
YRVYMYTTLAKMVEISIGKKDNIIDVSVDNEDPQLAAAMANAFVDELKKLNIKLNLSNAGRERAFLEERLEVVRADLIRAEESLREFQEKNKAIRIDAQATAIIEAVSRLRGELASKEVELGVLLTSHTEQNHQVRALREGIGQLKSQLRRLEDSPTGKNITQDIFIATSDVPDVGIRYARLMRDYKVQETLLELLTRQHEMAKITEAKNTSTLQVLDEAAVPDRKSRPKRSFLVLGATGVSFVLAIFLVFILEYVSRMPEQERRSWREVRARLLFSRGGRRSSGNVDP